MSDFNDHWRMIHFDFHMPDFVEGVGEAADFEAIVESLREANVNGIAIFTKGHYGNATYPTKMGNAHPNLGRDLVGGMTDACKRAGMLVRLYYSAAIDERVKREHPDWMRRNAASEIGSFVCFNGPYVTELAEPQIREIAQRYEFDEFFFDFAANANLAPCYCNHCRKAYRDAFGADLPASTNDADWERYAAWFRDVGYDFERRMAAAIHEYRPDVRVGYNWAYSTRMPEPPRDYVGYLTMDPAPNVLNYSLEGRYLSTLNRPYEIMTQRFIEHWGDWTMKPVNVLRQEFATVLANGGNCILGDKFHPDGTIDPAIYKRVAGLYDFVARRERLIRDAKPVPSIAVLHSASTFYGTGSRLFSNEHALAKLRGAHKMLVQSNEHFNVINERTLRDTIDAYGCVILPEQEVLAPETTSALYDYVVNGGTLIASYPFPRELDTLFGLEFEAPAESQWGYIGEMVKSLRRNVCNMPLVVHGQFGKFDVLRAQPLAAHVEPYPVRGFIAYNWQEPPPHRPSGFPAISTNVMGKGRGVAIAGPIFSSYARHDYPELRKLVANLLNLTMIEKRLSVTAPPCVEVTHWRRDRTDLIHLVNTRVENQLDRQWAVSEAPVPVEGIRVALQRSRRPKTVVLRPQGRRLKFAYRGGRVQFIVPRVKTHVCVVVK
ncbi:MAG: alpha-L-fucosidase [Phycisphaerae bacterium]|nr:alpha-L-fucosidase [Phycisphaerae bacterium]